MPPGPDEASIIDFFGSMPMVATAKIKTKLDGTNPAGIVPQAEKMWGSYRVKLPFAVPMNAPPFIPPT